MERWLRERVWGECSPRLDAWNLAHRCEASANKASHCHGLLPVISIGLPEDGNTLGSTKVLMASATFSTGSQYLGVEGYSESDFPDMPSLITEWNKPSLQGISTSATTSLSIMQGLSLLRSCSYFRIERSCASIPTPISMSLPSLFSIGGGRPIFSECSAFQWPIWPSDNHRIYHLTLLTCLVQGSRVRIFLLRRISDMILLLTLSC